MSQFNYQDYQAIIQKAQSGSNSAVKVGFFKLANDGDEALVRFNLSRTEDLQFATVHQFSGAQKFMKVSCLAPVGTYDPASSCPLCALAETNPNTVAKAKKKVFVQMMVAYKDAATGSYSAAIPVVWERPAGFSKEVAGWLRDYGDLHEHVLKITRNGAAGDMKTTYSVAYVPLYDKEELVAKDFSAFNNFDIAKHSYWVKTLEDINAFVQTGAFPQVANAAVAKAAPVAKPAVSVADVPVQPVVTAQPAFAVEQAQPTAVPAAQEAPAPTAQSSQEAQPIATDRPVRKFNNFTF